MSSRPAWYTIASSRTARTVTQKNPVLKNQKKQKKKVFITQRKFLFLNHRSVLDAGKAFCRLLI